MAVWTDVAHLPFDPELSPRSVGLSLLGDDLSAWTVLPLSGPPELASLDAYRTPIDVDDLVTSLFLGVDFDVDPTGNGDRRFFQLFFRLTSLEVPEPAAGLLLGVACAAVVALRRRATS